MNKYIACIQCNTIFLCTKKKIKVNKLKKSKKLHKQICPCCNCEQKITKLRNLKC